MIEWNEQGEVRNARWRSESGAPAPRRVELAKDTLSADSAYRFACAGTAMLWRSDFQNARLMLHQAGVCTSSTTQNLFTIFWARARQG